MIADVEQAAIEFADYFDLWDGEGWMGSVEYSKAHVVALYECPAYAEFWRWSHAISQGELIRRLRQIAECSARARRWMGG